MRSKFEIERYIYNSNTIEYELVDRQNLGYLIENEVKIKLQLALKWKHEDEYKRKVILKEIW